MSKHTPEPWDDEGGMIVAGENGLTQRVNIYDVDPSNRARIVACVNAMAGIDDPAACLATLRSQVAALTAQRDAMVEAADHADMQAWNLLAHEYGEHFRVNDTDTSKWADKVRAFLAASTALRSALALIKRGGGE
jgi:hypothetical protein